MANRYTTHILKNSNIPNRPLPSTLLAGEPIVNTADGIVYFSGVTASANNWVPAGTGTTASFFEVGSNLYNLQLRNRITKYEGVSGSGLTGKFLSGTTNGFVLADISSIVGVDSYVTGGTYNALTDTITISLNQGRPDVLITGITDTFTTGATLIGSTAYFNTNENLSAYTLDLSTFISTGDTYVTGGTYTSSASTLQFTNNTGGTFSVTGVTSSRTTPVLLDAYNGTRLAPLDPTLNGFHINKSINGNIGVSVINPDDSGNGAQANFTAKGSGALYTNNTGISHFGSNYYIPYLRGNGILYSDKKLFVSAINNNNIDFRTGVDLASATSKFNIGSGGTLTIGVKPTIDNSVIDLLARKSDGTIVIVEKSGLTDTYVTAFTYNNLSNTFTISQNNSQPSLSVSFTTVSGLTISDLTADRLVYTTTGGKLITGNAIFDGTDLTLPTTGSLSVGTGGLIVGSGGVGNLVVNGDLTVLGDSISAFTSQLYVEDNNIILNYNPTGNTTTTSIGAGLTIQDGNGLNGGDVRLEIRPLNGLTGLTATEIPDVSEYSGTTGYSNRGFVTELNDIILRSTDPTIPNGVRVLTEFDILDGGTY